MLIFSFKFQTLLCGEEGEGGLIHTTLKAPFPPYLLPPLDFVALNSISPSPPLKLSFPFIGHAKEPNTKEAQQYQRKKSKGARLSKTY